jgi:hypothetical protein
MSTLRVATALVAAAFVWAGAAAAHPHEFQDMRGLHWQPGVEPGEPGPGLRPRGKLAKVKTLGHHDPGGPSGDVVAHKSFAYLGSWGFAPDEEAYEAGTYCRALGVRVYNVRKPRHPKHVSTFADGASNPALAGSWTEKVMVRSLHNRWFKGDLAVVSFQDCRAGGFTGIGLYDVTDPRNPVELSLRQSGAVGVHELFMETRGNRAYVYEAALFNEVFAAFAGEDPEDADPEFRIVDVSNPRAPVQVGDWSAWRVLGISPLDALGTFPFNFVHSVVVFGRIAYVSYWDLGTVMLDVSDPADPEFLGRTEFGPGVEGNAHSAWIARGGKLLIQNDEDFDPSPNPDVETAWGYGRIFDISDRSNPVELATLKLPSTHQFPPPGPGDFTIHDPKVRGNTLYLSWYTEGVVVVSISKPSKPRMLAHWIPPEIGEDPLGFFFPGEEYAEVWGVFPRRHYVLASDINTGLWIFKVGH